MAADYFGVGLDRCWLALVNRSSWFSRVSRMLITEISPRYPLNRKLGRAQGLSGRFREERHFCHCRDSNPGSYNPYYTDQAILVAEENAV